MYAITGFTSLLIWGCMVLMPAAGQGTLSSLPVRLDHFHATNTDTLTMRFLYSEEFAPSGDVSYAFVNVGGSRTLDPVCLQDGLMRRMAQLLDGAMFCTEHRYYGESQPNSTLDTTNLRWLTGEQASADLAQFVQYLRNHFQEGRYRSVRVMLIGCGDGGSLAAWTRRAYPHLIASALVDSAPLKAQTNFTEYLEAIWSSLENAGREACPLEVRAASNGIRNLLYLPGGPSDVAQRFNTCTLPVSNEPIHPALMQWQGVVKPLGQLVENARPGDLEEFCSSFTNATILDPVTRLGAWVSSRTEGCLEVRHAHFIGPLQDTANSSPHADERVGLYQRCTQVGWWPSSSGAQQQLIHQMALPLTYFHQICANVFGQYFNEAAASAGAERVNLMFGGGQLADQVAWAGGASPWAVLGPERAAPATQIYRVQAGQCQFIGPATETDSAELSHARNLAIVSTLTWLTGEPYVLEGFDDGSGSAGRSPTAALLALAALLVAAMF